VNVTEKDLNLCGWRPQPCWRSWQAVSSSGCPSAGQSSTTKETEVFGFSTCANILSGNRRRADNPGPE